MGPGEMAAQYVRLTSTAVQTQWRLAREYADASARLARQGAPAATAATTARAARDEAVRWWRQAAELALGYGQALVDLNRDTGTRMVRSVATAPADALTVAVSGAPGETVREPVTIANTRTSTQSVTFSPGPLRSPDGTKVLAAWSFEPAELVLEPGEEQRVMMVLPLHPDLFPAGSTWSGPIAVQHDDEVVLELEVRLDVR